MAFEKLGITISDKADSDLRTKQYHAVKLTSTGVDLPGAVTDIPYGILQNAPNTGEEAVIAPIGCGGYSKMVCGATTFPARGELVQIEYIGAGDAGKGIKAATGNFPMGICILAGGAEDDLMTVLLAPIHKAITEDLP